MTRRITHHAILGSIDDDKIPFSWNGQILYGSRRDSLTSALLANDVRMLRRHEKDGKPRGLYCNIGHCSECRVTVDGHWNQRACMTPLEENMAVESQGMLPHLTEGGKRDV
ncbi:(2Fe-2S)-binding protein [Salinicoccus jeotgali]|uniref:(2Fe-2S)-binding protein n=1 Tax=Salinicoccus jeotgali TaxID=381634 RepID=A0ABP7FA17_9STAP